MSHSKNQLFLTQDRISPLSGVLFLDLAYYKHSKDIQLKFVFTEFQISKNNIPQKLKQNTGKLCYYLRFRKGDTFFFNIDFY